jgi:hypothetical protein
MIRLNLQVGASVVSAVVQQLARPPPCGLAVPYDSFSIFDRQTKWHHGTIREVKRLAPIFAPHLPDWNDTFNSKPYFCSSQPH